jgi:hypothetical protein
MTTVSPRYLQALPPDIAKVEWTNITQGWLHLEVPGAAETVDIAPGCTMQVRVSDLADHPWLAVLIKGFVQQGSLERVENLREVLHEALADGAHRIWENISGQSLKLRLPGALTETDIEPEGMVAFSVADLERCPDWAARLEWLEKRRLLRRVEG